MITRHKALVLVKKKKKLERCIRKTKTGQKANLRSDPGNYPTLSSGLGREEIVQVVACPATRDHDQSVECFCRWDDDDQTSDKGHHDGSTRWDAMLVSEAVEHADADDVIKNGLEKEVACHSLVTISWEVPRFWVLDEKKTSKKDTKKTYSRIGVRDRPRPCSVALAEWNHKSQSRRKAPGQWGKHRPESWCGPTCSPCPEMLWCRD